MKSLICVTLFFFFWSNVMGFPEISSRTFESMETMLNCVGAEHPFSDYYKYGCYCFVSDLPATADYLDETDKCCKEHLKCQADVMKNNVNCERHTFLTEIYEYACNEGSVSCGDPMTSPNTNCQFKFCECDRMCSECFAANTYHEEYMQNFTNEKCILKEDRKSILVDILLRRILDG